MSEQAAPKPPGNVIINVGAVIAVLLGIPCFIFGIFGVVNVVTGSKIIVGLLGTLWSYLAVTGCYELNRRKFDWDRGRRHRDRHLLNGTIAVSTGLVLSGAMHETMPGLAIVPALSAVIQANDGHDTKYRMIIHAAILAVGLCFAVWIYANGIIGKLWLERVATWP
ncbi:MAG: hypothetical protein R3192_13030 [Woeseiaceae bacterium]|nr:hypothetical protein [Woeseiaceae bacterium]